MADPSVQQGLGMGIKDCIAMLNSETRWQLDAKVRDYISFGVLLAVAVALTGCGGGAAPPPPPPDFSLSVSPSSVSAQVGTTTAPVIISVNAQPGFSGSVTVA